VKEAIVLFLTCFSIYTSFIPTTDEGVNRFR